ncbi:hypothetical protein EMPS_00856 [Entomortierella parvispora]|uniref:Uncharacterized protein n=1 Tax=Entomortierella parvispora TaxID=205924 RepID=A0A9P3H1V3_9FUNG|nr:hypothetical protein EMPS_00856 [Entomortierella parvispora]
MMSSPESWFDEINERRKGAGYFLLLTGRLQFNPVDYIKYRALQQDQSIILINEWARWMQDFKQSSFECARRAASIALALTQDDLDEYHRDRVSIEREQDALQSSKKQLLIADEQHSLRMEKRQAELVRSTSSTEDDVEAQSCTVSRKHTNDAVYDGNDRPTKMRQKQSPHLTEQLSEHFYQGIQVEDEEEILSEEGDVVLGGFAARSQAPISGTDRTLGPNQVHPAPLESLPKSGTLSVTSPTLDGAPSNLRQPPPKSRSGITGKSNQASTMTLQGPDTPVISATESTETTSPMSGSQCGPSTLSADPGKTISDPSNNACGRNEKTRQNSMAGQSKEGTLGSAKGVSDVAGPPLQNVNRCQSKKAKPFRVSQPSPKRAGPSKCTQRKPKTTSPLPSRGGRKKSLELAPPNPHAFPLSSGISETKKRRRTERFESLDASKFWKLSTGTCVEETLFKASLTADANIKIRSYAIDFECPITRRLFTDKEWNEIAERNQFVLPPLSKTTVDYLLKAKEAIIAQQSVVTVPLPMDDQGSCELAQATFQSWERMYRKIPSPFVVHDLSESYWGRKSWPLLMELLEDQDNIFMLDGEKMGLESSKRRNAGRQWKPDVKTPRKIIGRKLDLIARDVQDLKDWMIVERMRTWDEVSKKFMKETSYDLFRETHSIMTGRLQDTMNRNFKYKARFFGIYSGDRGYQSFELRPAGIGSHVSLFKEYPVYELPTSLGDMRAHIQGVVHLLQIRLCMIHTMRAYYLSEQDLEGDAWIYGNSRNERDVVPIVASSPIASPEAWDPTLDLAEGDSSSASSPDPVQTMNEDDLDELILYGN